MGQSNNQNIDVYGRDAGKLSQSYNAVTTDAILPKFTARVEALCRAKGGAQGLSALDIGCGTGRDASWLAAQGFQVAACDGAAGMIAAAQQGNAHAQIDYFVDTAPELTATLARGQRYDVILMNAFIFHFDYRGKDNALSQLFDHVVTLGQPDALIYTNLRHGPIPAGRQMFDIPADVVADHAKARGLIYEDLGRSADGLGRADVSWTDIVLRFPS